MIGQLSARRGLIRRLGQTSTWYGFAGLINQVLAVDRLVALANPKVGFARLSP